MNAHLTVSLRALLAALALRAPALAADECTLKTFELPVKIIGSRAIATVGINGTDVPLVVDTGAFFSFLTEAAAQQLNLPLQRAPRGLSVRGLTGEVDVRVTTVKRMQLLNHDIPDVEFIVGGNEPGAGAMGLLGRNVLAATDTEYDLAHGVIRLVDPQGDCADKSMAYWAQEAPVVAVPLRREIAARRPGFKVTLKLNGVEMTAMLDTGALSTASLDAARRAQVAAAEMTPAAPRRGAGRGEAPAWTAPFKSFAIGGEQITLPRLPVADFRLDDIDMLLGIDWFLSHRIYVSQRQRKLYFTYNGGPVFASNATPEGEAEASGLSPQEVQPALADAEAYARRGAASAARRDFTRALDDLNRAIELAPDAAEHRLQRAQVQLALKHAPEALQDFDSALRLDPGQRDARLGRATLRALQGQRDAALADLQTLDGQAAPQAHLRLEMAQLYLRLGQPALALPQLDQWIAAHRSEVRLPSALNDRCWARMLLGADLDQALADCNDALDLQPRKAAYLDSRAWVQLRRGKLRDALADFDRALKLQRDDAWSLYGRGIARIRLDDAEAGRADIEAARRLRPDIDAEAGRHGLAAADAATAFKP